MKKLLLILFIIAISTECIYSQNSGPKAKKPLIMVVPSDVWCNQQGYMKEYANQGANSNYPDYKRALQEHYELNQVISKIGELMSEEDFPLVDLASSLNKMENDQAFIDMMTSNNTGSALAESPIDILNRVAKADIIIKMSWQVNKLGPKKSVSYNLQGIDAYTNKQIAASSGTGPKSSNSELAILFQQAVQDHMDQFNSQLIRHFNDIVTNGREGSLVVRVWEDSPVNLETEFEFKGRTAELKRIIADYWMPRNTENGSFSQDQASAYVQSFSQVRISLFIEDELWGGTMALDFNSWGQQLADLLRNELDITSKIVPRGLGEVNLIIGGK